MRSFRKHLIIPAVSILFFFMAFGAFGQTKRIRPVAEHLVFKAKRLIDPSSGETIEDVLIETANGRILKVTSAQGFRAPAGLTVVDLSDKYVIPGLIDTHGHLFGGMTTRHTTCDMHAAFYLAAGVTSVRSPGSMEPEGDIGLMNRINSGRYLGPRYFHSGPYVEGDPVTVGWMNPVVTPEEVKLKIDQLIRNGATSVKIYASMKGDVLKAAIEHGHAYGVKVIGHIGAVTYREAIAMGIDELFHGILAMPDILPKDIDQKDFKKVMKILSELDMSGSEMLDILRLAAEHRVVLTPTADVVEPMELARNHMEEQKQFYTPEAWGKLLERIEKPVFPDGEEILSKNKEFIRLAHEAGCILSTGTDQVGFSLLPGFSLWREMEIFAEAGLAPMEVLKAATVNGAYALGRSDLLGSVEPGKLADFVVLDADPLENISHVRRVHMVVKGGVVYEPGKLLTPLIGKYN
ncbi:MAG: amidohydrolase family protein [Candidatus Aminicenantes bacterium]|nr:amidohydrolase family protein [Candidatus Aminicenantes bacterium]